MRRPPRCIIALVLLAIVTVLVACILPACAPAGASSKPEALLGAPMRSPITPSFAAHDPNGVGSLTHDARISNDISDVLSDVLDGAADTAASVADTVTGIKDGAEQAVADWQAEREAAKAHAREVVESAELVPNTKKLEYSKSKADSLSLVKCSDPQVRVSCDDEIDLTTLGSKEITYTLSFEGQRANRTVKFTVRDTKKPTIKLVNKSVSIDQGARYNPLDNISSVKDPVDGELPLNDAAPKKKRASKSASSPGTKSSSKSSDDPGWYTVEGNVDTSTPGVYPIKITATDNHGNAKSKTFDVTVIEPEPEPETEGFEEATPEVRPYVLNTNTMKFHRPGCRATNQMSDSNRWDVEMTRDEIVEMGYQPCGICHP